MRRSGDSQEPTVSVVVLTYDRQRSLARCLESLRLQQVDVVFEIVVADDGSGAETERVILEACRQDSRIRSVRHDHRGIPATRNLGVAAARGHFVAIVADDYLLAPTYLTRALRYLDSHPSAAVVRADILPSGNSLGARISHCFYSASFSRRLAMEGLSPSDAAAGVRTSTLEASGAAVFRAEALAATGPWDESLLRGEDTEHTARLRACGAEVHLLAAGTVRQEYRAVPIDTLHKCFVTGIYRARLGPDAAPRTTGKARDLVRALDRARLGGDSWWAVAWYLPWMALFEVAVYSGVLVGRAQIAAGRRRRGTRERRMPDSSVR